MNKLCEHELDELDVFEATQYFYGEVEAGGLIGLHGPSLAAEEREEESSGVQQRKVDEGLVIGSSSSLSSMVKDKRWKQPRSPGAKLVSYLNHFFNRVASSRKLKCLNPSTSTREEEEEAKEEDKWMQKSLAAQSESSRSRNNTFPSRRSKSSFGSKPSNFCGSSSFASPNSQKGIAESEFETWGSRLGGARVESRWVLKPGSEDHHLTRDWFHQGHKLPFSRAAKEFTHFGRVRREEINGDDDDDEDLFELKDIYTQEDLSDGLPVFATTSIAVTKTKTTISSTP
ncbi:protein BIG GRAIN 1-like B [Zingiber officinale]|uniref:protein BIG GRAIN 1-like B n=1 Tax=Zingiber officinale TaxID=94328 RepID=UPI001C4CBB7E|nr:protein BIG GRAIN 1-like B [Zingiber officinale]